MPNCKYDEPRLCDARHINELETLAQIARTPSRKSKQKEVLLEIMNIRTATKEDLPALAELLHQLFAIEVDFTPDYDNQAKGLELLMARPSARIFVAEIDGQVVGMCTVQVLVSTAMGQEVGAVEDVIIDVEHRGKSIGSALMRTVEAWAATKGLGRLQLRADKDNGPALCFYRQQGWKHTNLIGWMKFL